MYLKNFMVSRPFTSWLIKCDVNIAVNGLAPCTQGSIRLEGNTTTSGRVEVCHINVWGTVCGDYNWGLTDAQVACRQLGLPTTGATTLTFNSVPNNTKVSWLSNVRCLGVESSLFNCPASIIGSSCHRSDAGVSCQASKY